MLMMHPRRARTRWSLGFGRACAQGYSPDITAVPDDGGMQPAKPLVCFGIKTQDQGMTVRPRRSVLYMPGSNARALEKARDLPADCLILDLEDAVAPEAKG